MAQNDTLESLALEFRYPACARLLSGDVEAMAQVWINRHLILSLRISELVYTDAATKRAVKKRLEELQRLCIECTDALESRDGGRIYEFMQEALEHLKRIAVMIDGERYKDGLFVSGAYA